MLSLMRFSRPRHPVRWIAGAVAVIAVLAVGGPYVYIHFFNSAPAALSLPAASAGAGSASGGTAAGTSVAGTWNTTKGSVVGYRVGEVLLGQNTTAVGRSSSATGHLTIAGTDVTAASFSVPISTIHSDKSQRDAQFDGRIMDSAKYPTGTFALTSNIDLTPLPADNKVESFTAHGNLTLHGTTKAVTFTLKAELTGGKIEVSGQIPVLFSDYGIPNPSLAGFVTTQNHGILEFLLVLTRN
jgi:polyisoprenoid-binding protein YceI